MPDYTNNPYATGQVITDDGSVAFDCSLDTQRLPWLTLPPHHPVVIQTQAFWTAVGASVALSGLEATQWSALTWIDWDLGDQSGGHAVRGVYTRDESSDNPSYDVVLFNAAGAVIVTIRGRGVVFRNRNFEKWREGSKEEARKAAPQNDFVYAERQALGLTRHERVLVAPFATGSDYVEALVTPQNGFPPGNPVIGGSGDHVNSTHFHEIARQALFLIKGRTDIDTSGEMTLRRYVELGTPLRLNIHEDAERAITFELEQMDRTCAEITLRW
ncbi:hypothetical protein CD351_04095 [Erythrobacter sp. KY5]|uniref:hypothetical protein n=1 Tax=Erythrobacter sp. KY5 TaxID=2011159 RepID=UPI000DBF2D08|nr:hypothetical protein [Erythrobacter sp. KY5]AWW73608.1 hypothetical protein CD351_04095 [Erythrobacter sp. KY5]